MDFQHVLHLSLFIMISSLEAATPLSFRRDPQLNSIYQLLCSRVTSSRCSTKCQSGYTQDSNGCLTCQCKDPCEQLRCPEDKHCTIRTTTRNCAWGSCEMSAPVCVEEKTLVKNICRFGKPISYCGGRAGAQPCQKTYKCEVDPDAKFAVCCPNVSPNTFSKEPLCEQRKDPGLCQDRQLRYYFNSTSRKCETFFYSGCQGNRNNFESLRSCKEACGDYCTLPADAGRCRASMTRYNFNPNTGKCESFTYGGCDGNGNNFFTEEECKGYCLPV